MHCAQTAAPPPPLLLPTLLAQFWDIKPANNVNGVLRYRIWLNGRSYCFPDTRGKRMGASWREGHNRGYAASIIAVHGIAHSPFRSALPPAGYLVAPFCQKYV